MKQLTAAIVLFASVAAIAQEAPENPNDPAVLWSQATLYRDEWGVPHIYAENLRAMAFAFGYAQAEDHLDPMLLTFRAVKGRSAEVLGEVRLPQDTYALQMRFDELAREAVESVDFDVRDLCEGFALGVNTWLLENPDRAPDWAEGIQPHEVLSLLHAFLLAHAPFDLPEADVRDPGILSANAWAVAPEHSTTNHAMLVINPHAQFEGIFRWYEAHLVADGYELAGSTIYGLPILLHGHNDRLGWAVAPNEADIADLYDEDSFGHLKSTERYHDVFVKTGEELEKRVVLTWQSGNGPIVATHAGKPYAWKVGGYGEFETLGQLFDMGRAQGVDDFVEALNINALPAFNVVYADAEGNTAFFYNAVAGVRPSLAMPASDDTRRTVWEKPVPAYTPGFDWQERIAPARLPAIFNPDAGYIVGSGTPPSGIAGGISAAEWTDLDWLIRDEDTPRAERTRELFDRGPRSLHDLQSMLFDHALPAAEPRIAFLSEAAAAFPELVRDGHPDLPVALDSLGEWDRIAATESAEMTWFHIWNTLYKKLIPELNALPSTEVLQKTALRAASDASRLLTNTYQTPFVPWGDVHRLKRGDIEMPLAGGTTGEPIFYSGDSTYVGGKWIADSGYAHAMVVQFSDPATTLSLVPFGASDRLESPHYSDQTPLLSERRMKVFHTRREDVLRAAVSGRGADLEFVDRSNRVRVYVTSDATLEGRLVTAHRFDRRVEDGLAAFTPFVEPVITPAEADIAIDFIFTVPDGQCSADALDELAIYAFHPQTGWTIVEDQYLDAEQRALHARDYYDQVYVVLGPEQHLRRDPVDRSSHPAVADVPLQLLPDAPPQRPSVQTSASNPLEAELDEARQQQRQAETVQREDNPFGASPGVLVFSPDEELTEDAVERIAARSTEPEPAAPLESAAPTVAVRPTEPEQTSQSTESSPPRPATEPSGGPSYETQARDDDTIVVRGRSSRPDELPNARSGSRLTISYEPPSEMRADQPESFELYLAPGGATASELRIGTDLDISPPVEGVLVRLHADSTVRAQGYVADVPPTPFPNGLIAFTPVVVTRRAPESVSSSVAVTLRVSPTRCDPANAGKLTLYVHDSERGWMPLEQATTPVPLSYQAVDLKPRTYAVLGPSSVRRN